jgi:hypothetical protein
MNELEFLSFIIVILYVLFDTDAIPEYLGLIDKNWFKINDYNKFKQIGSIPLSYLEWLSSLFPNNFFLKLLSCSTCLIPWLVFLFNFLCNLNWKTIGYEILIVWVTYPLLRRIIKKLYE